MDDRDQNEHDLMKQFQLPASFGSSSSNAVRNREQQYQSRLDRMRRSDSAPSSSLPSAAAGASDSASTSSSVSASAAAYDDDGDDDDDELEFGPSIPMSVIKQREEEAARANPFKIPFRFDSNLFLPLLLFLYPQFLIVSPLPFSCLAFFSLDLLQVSLFYR